MSEQGNYERYFCTPVMIVLAAWTLITAVMMVVGPWINQS